MKCKTETESYLRNVALPQATKSYTPIAHGDIIDEVREALKLGGFAVKSELYKAEQKGEVAAGFMEISDSNLDEDMAMTFNWTNSYNKMLRFSCGIGGLIYDNNVPFVSRDAQVTWARKHTGTAKEESTNVINQMISQAVHHFGKIVAMKDKFKAIEIDREEYSKLMGLLFFDKDILGIEQSTQIRNEYNNPSFDYSGKGTLWEVYKIIMFGVKEQSPKTWYKQQIEINTFITLRYYDGVPGKLTASIQDDKANLPSGFDNTTVDDHADLTSLNSKEKVDMNAMYEKQMAGRDEDNYYVGTDDEGGDERMWEGRVDDTPEITGIPNGDTISDTDDTEPELVDVAFEDDGRAVPVYEDGAGNVDYPEVEADAEMQEIKTEEIIEEKDEEDDAPVYDEDRIAESIREDEAAVAEVCDERIIVTEDTPPLTAKQLSSATFEENESGDDFDMVVDAPSTKKITDEQVELLKEENEQIILPTPVEEQPTLPLGGDDFNSCPPPTGAPEKEEESIVSKVKTVYDEPIQVYPNAEVKEISDVDGVTVVDLDSDEFFVLD